MSSRTLAAAKARRAGENAPPVSGNRPITSIGSQAAFAQQQMPPGMAYNMPPPPNNVRTARSLQQPPQQYGRQPPQQYQQFYDKQNQNPQMMHQQMPQQQSQPEGLPFSRLSVSDAIGLITLRLGRVEQWIIDTDHENETNPKSVTTSNIPDNHKVIDSSVFNNIINRLDSLEKNGSSLSSTEELTKLTDEFKILKEQFTRMSDDVNKHTIELSKNTEQVFRFNRELTETKDILKAFMVKYDMFAQEITQNFADYETALSDLETRLNPIEQDDENTNIIDDTEQTGSEIGTNINDIDAENNVIMSVDLKNIIKQELSNS